MFRHLAAPQLMTPTATVVLQIQLLHIGGRWLTDFLPDPTGSASPVLLVPGS